MSPPRVWKAGERCSLTCEGRTVPAEVVLASDNGESLALDFEAILAGHVGTMPVLWDGCGFVAVFGHAPVELGEPREEPAP